MKNSRSSPWKTFSPNVLVGQKSSQRPTAQKERLLWVCFFATGSTEEVNVYVLDRNAPTPNFFLIGSSPNTCSQKEKMQMGMADIEPRSSCSAINCSKPPTHLTMALLASLPDVFFGLLNRLLAGDQLLPVGREEPGNFLKRLVVAKRFSHSSEKTSKLSMTRKSATLKLSLRKNVATSCCRNLDNQQMLSVALLGKAAAFIAWICNDGSTKTYFFRTQDNRCMFELENEMAPRKKSECKMSNSANINS